MVTKTPFSSVSFFFFLIEICVVVKALADILMLSCV